MADVCIVGGGIGGAALALALARGGRTSLVLERTAAPGPAGRPEILWPATMAALDRLGVGEEIRATAAVPVTAIEIRPAGASDGPSVLLRLGDGTLRHATDPLATRAAILRAAEATGLADVRRGVEVQDVSIGRDGVWVGATAGDAGGAPAEFRAPVVVGDDGARSRVRDALGIAITTTTFPAEFAGTDVEAPDLPRDLGRAWLDPSGLRDGIFGVLCVPLPRRRVALVCLLAPGSWDGLVAAGADAFRRRCAEIAPPLGAAVAEAPFPAGFVRAVRPVGHADRYVGDRGAILGDAAHPMSPAGGQGANAAIADALALADVLLVRLPTGDFSAAALAPYEDARRAANERSLEFSRRGARAISAARAVPSLLVVARAAVAVARHTPAVRRRIVEAFATAYVGEQVRVARR